MRRVTSKEEIVYNEINFLLHFLYQNGDVFIELGGVQKGYPIFWAHFDLPTYIVHTHIQLCLILDNLP